VGGLRRSGLCDSTRENLPDRLWFRSFRASSSPRAIDKYGPVYSLDGKYLGATHGLTHEDHPTGLAGANAVAGSAATDEARAKKFSEALWNTPIPPGQNRYYDGMLYLMSLMHLSGEFRIWAPQ
jgi:oligosaccharide reducing-end xylanase